MSMPHVMIVFSRPRTFSWASFLVRMVERTSYSHVCLMFYDDKLERYVVYQADESNVNVMAQDTFLKYNDQIWNYVFVCPESDVIKAQQFCIDRSGWSYNKLQAFGVGLRYFVYRFFKKDIHNPFKKNQQKQICTELVGKVLQILGAKITDEEIICNGVKWIHTKVIEFAEANHEKTIT